MKHYSDEARKATKAHITEKAGEDKDKYVQVYLRLDSSNTYEWGKGSIGIEDKDKRNELSKSLAKQIGFNRFIAGGDSLGASAGNLETCETMYVHPMEVTLILLPKNIDKTKRAVESLQSPLFKLMDMDVYELHEKTLYEALRHKIHSLLHSKNVEKLC